MLTHNDELILLAIVRLGNNAYGVRVRELLTVATGREWTVGAVYTTLDRLEERGLVESRQGEPTPARGGRAKRYYNLTLTAMKALKDAELARERLR